MAISAERRRIMEVFTANEAKNRFGEVILKSQMESVQVTRSGNRSPW
jgi:hypothetical protein